MARRNSYQGKYQLNKTEYLSAKYYALRYKEWGKERRRLETSLRSIAMDGEEDQEESMRKIEQELEEIGAKTAKIEEAARETDAGLSKWLIRAVTEEGLSYDYFRLVHKIPCGRRQFYEKKRRFYFILAKKI